MLVDFAAGAGRAIKANRMNMKRVRRSMIRRSDTWIGKAVDALIVAVIKPVVKQ